MNRFKAPLLLGLLMTLGVGFGYCNVKRAGDAIYEPLHKLEDRLPAIKLKRGEELDGDMPLRCKGYGGYEINVGYSATSLQFTINRVSRGNQDVVVSTMQADQLRPETES